MDAPAAAVMAELLFFSINKPVLSLHVKRCGAAATSSSTHAQAPPPPPPPVLKQCSLPHIELCVQLSVHLKRGV